MIPLRAHFSLINLYKVPTGFSSLFVSFDFHCTLFLQVQEFGESQQDVNLT